MDDMLTGQTLLWALDPQQDGPPIAHLIISRDQPDPMRTDCGLTYYYGTPDQLYYPSVHGRLPEPGYRIHCGQWAASYRIDGTWSCTADHATHPCGQCQPCKQIAAAPDIR